MAVWLEGPEEKHEELRTGPHMRSCGLVKRGLGAVTIQLGEQ